MAKLSDESVREGTMGTSRLIKLGHPVLRRIAAPVPPQAFADGTLQELVDGMIAVMRAHKGVGLAAPQVGHSLRLCVIEKQERDKEDDLELTVLVNPRIVSYSDDVIEGWEGCLSIDNLRGMVRRSRKIRVTAQDTRGNATDCTMTGFAAVVVQHEVDHLDGILFLDRMKDLSTLTQIAEWEEFWLHAKET